MRTVIEVQNDKLTYWLLRVKSFFLYLLTALRYFWSVRLR